LRGFAGVGGGTSGGSALALVELLEPLKGKTVLTSVRAACRVLLHAARCERRGPGDRERREAAAERMRGYGAAETIDHTAVSLPDAVRQAHPDGIDALMDLVSQAEAFSGLASLVRSGGTAVTTQYVADVDALAAAGVTGINFAFQASSELFERLADALVSGRIVAPPIARIALEEAPAVLSQAQPRPADGKTVIKL
jgi:NADPH:quinone reductase